MMLARDGPQHKGHSELTGLHSPAARHESPPTGHVQALQELRQRLGHVADVELLRAASIDGGCQLRAGFDQDDRCCIWGRGGGGGQTSPGCSPAFQMPSQDAPGSSALIMPFRPLIINGCSPMSRRLDGSADGLRGCADVCSDDAPTLLRSWQVSMQRRGPPALLLSTLMCIHYWQQRKEPPAPPCVN